MAKTMRIGQLAQQFGLNPKTIRYYEEVGLLPAAERTESGYRQYAEADAERLDFIGKAKRLGLSLQEIRGILGVRDEGLTPCSHVIELLDQRIAQVDRALNELAAFRSELLSVRGEAAVRVPEGAVCGIIEHHNLASLAVPIYLRGRGLATGGRGQLGRREERQGAQAQPNLGQQRRDRFELETLDLDLDEGEGLDFDLDWKV